MVSTPTIVAQHITLHNQYARGSDVKNIRFLNDSKEYKRKYQVSIYDKLKKEDEEMRRKRSNQRKVQKLKDKIEDMDLSTIENEGNMRDDISILSVESGNSGVKKHIPLQLSTSKIKNFITSLSLSRPATKTAVDLNYQKKIKRKFVRNSLIMEKVLDNFNPLVKEDKAFLLNSVLTLNKQMHRLVEKQLYSRVSFESTYRLAQFLATLEKSSSDFLQGVKKHKLGEFVVSLDISSLKSGADIYKKYYGKYIADEVLYEDMSLATWRDWRMKSSLIYGDKMRTLPSTMRKRAISTTSIVTICTTNSDQIHDAKWKKLRKKRKLNLAFIKRKMQFKKNPAAKARNIIKKQHKSTPQAKQQVSESSNITIKHPLINFHLLKYKDNRDIPIGFIIHFLKLCKNLKHLNMDKLSISEDFLLLDSTHSKNINVEEMIKIFINETNIRFLSDTSINQFNLTSKEHLGILTFNNFFQIFVELLDNLKIRLESLSLKQCYFVKRTQVQNMLLNNFSQNEKQSPAGSFQVDFYKATMRKDYHWCNTSVKDWQDVSVLILLCNLGDFCKEGGKLLAKFSLSMKSEGNSFFESQVMDINGTVNPNTNVNFKLCFNIANKNQDDSYKVEHKTDKKGTAVKINLYFKIQKYYDINEMTRETNFINFHENMSYILLSQNIRKGNLDFRYYNILILCEYLLIRLNKEYYERGLENIGFNSFSF